MKFKGDKKKARFWDEECVRAHWRNHVAANRLKWSKEEDKHLIELTDRRNEVDDAMKNGVAHDNEEVCRKWGVEYVVLRV